MKDIHARKFPLERLLIACLMVVVISCSSAKPTVNIQYAKDGTISAFEFSQNPETVDMQINDRYYEITLGNTKMIVQKNSDGKLLGVSIDDLDYNFSNNIDPKNNVHSFELSMFDYKTVSNIQMKSRSEQVLVSFGDQKRVFDYTNGSFIGRK